MSDVTVLNATTPAESGGSSSTRTISYTPTAGEKRIVLALLAISADFGGTLGTAAGTSATFGGNAMTLKGQDVVDSGLSINKSILGVAAIELDDDSTGALDFVLTLNGSGGRVVGYQFITLGNCMPEDAALDQEYSEGSTTSAADVTLQATPDADSDMVVALPGWQSGIMSGFTPSTYVNFDGGTYGTVLSTNSGGFAPRIRFVSKVGVTAEQTLVAARTTGAGEPVVMQAFVIRHYVSTSGGGGGPADADGVNYNCACVDNENETLAELRVRMLVRLGFAAVAANPPPGMAALVDQFLITQNKLMYQKYPALRTRRLFKWTLEQGVRFYGLRDNDQNEDCLKYFDITKPIVGVYLRDLNGSWLPMTAGIPPTFYTTVQQPALPLRYEIRSCIEIFPGPPADGYEMWIKAQQTPDAFAEDDDQTTVSSELVFLQALADGLDYYGKPSAKGVYARANEYLGELVASTHITKRYVPGTRDLPPAIMPIFAPWPGEY